MAARYTPGSLSYSYGSTGYRFGWADGFTRGYEVGVIATQRRFTEGKTEPHSDTEVFFEREQPPDYAMAMSAHEANPGANLQLKGKRVVDSILDSLPAKAASTPGTRSPRSPSR